MAEDGPVWTPDQVALLADARLTGDARVVGLLLSHAGEQGLSYLELEELLPDASRDRLRVAVQKLERFKWADRLIGGRGHGDRFVYIACPPGATYQADRLAIFGTAINRMPASGNLKALSVPASSNLRRPSSTTPLPPPPLDARAREWALSSEVLKGCRGSLLDYLSERVHPDKQLAYAQTVAGIIEGTDERLWKDRTGVVAVTKDRAKIVAGCLNELRQGDEVGQYFTGPPGDVRNLQSKIRYRVKSETDAKRDAERKRDTPRAAAAARAEPGAGVVAATPEVHVER